jgi:hypothetical protein
LQFDLLPRQDSRVYFSDKVSKLDDKGKKLGAKTVLITNVAIYVVGGLFKKVNAYVLDEHGLAATNAC